MKPLDMWKGEFGTKYAARNKITQQAMEATTDLWGNILGSLYVPPDFWIYEVGANVGLNMVVLDGLLDAHLYASEPNKEARNKLKELNLCEVNADALPKLGNSLSEVYDLVFTSGVLIHIPTINLIPSVEEIYRVSKKYIVAIEYFSTRETELEYRGNAGMMWTRDYGSVYLDRFPDLKCVNYGFVWGRDTGLDSLNWWLLEKTA